jgi:hypothetical protein
MWCGGYIQPDSTTLLITKKAIYASKRKQLRRPPLLDTVSLQLANLKQQTPSGTPLGCAATTHHHAPFCPRQAPTQTAGAHNGPSIDVTLEHPNTHNTKKQEHRIVSLHVSFTKKLLREGHLAAGHRRFFILRISLVPLFAMKRGRGKGRTRRKETKGIDVRSEIL